MQRVRKRTASSASNPTLPLTVIIIYEMQREIAEQFCLELTL
jgi:hypothetical protein